MDKWAGGDPPFPICGGGEREPRVIISSDVGMYGTKKIKEEVDRSTRWWGSVDCDGGRGRREMDKSTPPQKMKKMKLPSRRRGRKKNQNAKRSGS